MRLFGRKNRDDRDQRTVTPAGADLRSQSELRADPNLIKVFDEFGREAFITKQQWLTSVLPGTLKSNWNNPDQLYGIIAGALQDGFHKEVLNAAEHLRQIDSDAVRGACVHAIVLMKNQRLDEAEQILRFCIEKNGAVGYVLTNLAKVYSARNETQRAEDTLWHALKLDPNQDNGFSWYLAIHREKGGPENAQDALRRVAALPSSWRAQLWLARAALDAHDLRRALTYYEEGLSRIGPEPSSDFLMQMSGDLGKHGYLIELVRLTEPRFVPAVHGLQVGNNLLKAYLDLNQTNDARRVLDQLYSLKRPDYKEQLSFWDTEIAKARIKSVTVGDPLSHLTSRVGTNEPRIRWAYQPPQGQHFSSYLLRLEQLFAVRFAGTDGIPENFLNGEIEILDGNLQLCLACPDNVTTRILLGQTLLAMSRIRPKLAQEFSEKVNLLMQKYPIIEPAQTIIQRMLEPILAR